MSMNTKRELAPPTPFISAPSSLSSETGADRWTTRSLCPFQLRNPENKRSRRERVRYPHGAQEKEYLVDCTVAQEGGFADPGGQHALRGGPSAWRDQREDLDLEREEPEVGSGREAQPQSWKLKHTVSGVDS